MEFLTGGTLVETVLFQSLMRPSILMNVHVLEVKKIGYIKTCWVKKTSEKLWTKGKGNRLPTESMTLVVQVESCIAVILVVGSISIIL